MYDQEKHDVYLTSLEQNFEEFFSRFYDESRRNIKALSKGSTYPKLDAFTKDDNYIIVCSMPGVLENNLKIEIEFKNSINLLVISGKASFTEYEDAVYSIRELKRSAFCRKLEIPNNLLGEPEVTFKNCVLTLCWKIKKVNASKEVKTANKRSISISPPVVIKEEIFGSGMVGKNHFKNLTVGKKYKIIDEMSGYYIVLNDLGNKESVDAVYFDADVPGVKYTISEPLKGIDIPDIKTALIGDMDCIESPPEEDVNTYRYLAGLITRDDLDTLKKEEEQSKLKEAYELSEKDIIKYEIFDELYLCNLPKLTGDKIKKQMTNGKAYGIFKEIVSGPGGQKLDNELLNKIKLASDYAELDQKSIDLIDTYYLTLNDSGEKIVVPAYCFDAIPLDVVDNCVKMFDAFGNVADIVGLSCEKNSKHKRSTERDVIVDTCFSGKDTSYNIESQGTIITNTINGSIYMGSNLVCRFMYIGDSDTPTLIHVDNNNIKVKSVKYNKRNFGGGIIIEWFVVPGKTKLSLDYDCEYRESLAS